MSDLCLHYFLDGVDDGLVPRAAAVVPRNMQANFFARGFAVLAEEILRCHQHARCAETALQRVALVKRLLQRRKLLRVAQPFDGLHPAAVRLHREHQAAAHDLAVDPQGARAAYAVLAADMRPGEAELLSQEIHQVLARRHAPADLRAVDRQGDVESVVHARLSSTLASCSLVAALW